MRSFKIAVGEDSPRASRCFPTVRGSTPHGHLGAAVLPTDRHKAAAQPAHFPCARSRRWEYPVG